MAAEPTALSGHRAGRRRSGALCSISSSGAVLHSCLNHHLIRERGGTPVSTVMVPRLLRCLRPRGAARSVQLVPYRRAAASGGPP